MHHDEIAKLIPLPVTTDAEGTRLPSFDWVYPRGEAYEAQARATLPAGWALYSDLDAEKHPTTCAKDFGATREDGRASVYGIRESWRGKPAVLRAHVYTRPGQIERDRPFEPGQLAEACRWCDEQLATGQRS